MNPGELAGSGRSGERGASPEPLAGMARPRRLLADIAIARSGDKGRRATLSVVALDAADFPWLEGWLTAERVAAAYRGVVHGEVVRHALPQLAALQFVMDDALAGGVTRSLALDAHGKTLASLVLGLELP
jgi:hypothetical protein